MEIKAEFEVAKWDKEPVVQMLYSILLYSLLLCPVKLYYKVIYTFNSILSCVRLYYTNVLLLD